MTTFSQKEWRLDREDQRRKGFASVVVGSAPRMVGEWRSEWSRRPGSNGHRVEQLYDKATTIIERHLAESVAASRPGQIGLPGPLEAMARLRDMGSDLKALAKAQKDLERAQAAAENFAENLLPLEPSNDISSALRRREIRDRLAAMPDDKRRVLLRDNPSDEVVVAACELPPELTGLPVGDYRAALRESIVRRNGAEAVGETPVMLEALATTRRAIEAAGALIESSLSASDRRELAFALDDGKAEG